MRVIQKISESGDLFVERQHQPHKNPKITHPSSRTHFSSKITFKIGGDGRRGRRWGSKGGNLSPSLYLIPQPYPGTPSTLLSLGLWGSRGTLANNAFGQDGEQVVSWGRVATPSTLFHSPSLSSSLLHSLYLFYCLLFFSPARKTLGGGCRGGAPPTPHRSGYDNAMDVFNRLKNIKSNFNSSILNSRTYLSFL